MPRRGELQRVTSLEELEELVRGRSGTYLRWSHGPEADEGNHSRDTLTGKELPGLCVSPLDQEEWWDGSARTWVARRVHDYAHLAAEGPEIVAWVLTGEETGRGPDNEPLVEVHQPLALLERNVLEEAEDELTRAGRMEEWGTLARTPRPEAPEEETVEPGR